MNRREALKAASIMLGGAVMGLQALSSGCRTTGKDEANDAFTDADRQLLDEIGETILPATDTPGAKATGIGAFMIMMVLDTCEEKDRKAFQDGLKRIRADFEDMFGHSFMEGSAEERHRFLNKLNAELAPYKDQKKDDDPEHYFRMMKELTILGYFSSEIGSRQALRYVEIPGRYEGDIPYEKGDRAWAVASY